jgi:hypothetical protein
MDFVTEDLKAFVVELAEEAHHFKAFNHLFFSCYPKNIGGSIKFRSTPTLTVVKNCV